MKKIISLILILFSVTLFAQENPKKGDEMSNEEMATLQAKRLSMQLDLNAEQEEKLKTFYAKRIEAQRMLIEEQKEERKEMRKERMEMNEAQKAELREILTKEQYVKWEQLQEKRRKGRKTPMREKNE